MKVQFQTRGGQTVKFTANPKKKAKKANDYAKYVQRHIGKFLRQGQEPTQAMKSVARQYKKR